MAEFQEGMLDDTEKMQKYCETFTPDVVLELIKGKERAGYLDFLITTVKSPESNFRMSKRQREHMDRCLALIGTYTNEKGQEEA